MGTTVQARLDKKAEAALRVIAKSEGWTASQVIRECLMEGAAKRAAKPRPRLIGIGCFDSGVSDLATNKEHMRDFGLSSMGKGWQRPEERSGKRKVRAK
jgi:hypothetical protein